MGRTGGRGVSSSLLFNPRNPSRSVHCRFSKWQPDQNSFSNSQVRQARLEVLKKRLEPFVGKVLILALSYSGLQIQTWTSCQPSSLLVYGTMRLVTTTGLSTS